MWTPQYTQTGSGSSQRDLSPDRVPDYSSAKHGQIETQHIVWSMARPYLASWFVDDLIPVILESNKNWWPRDLVRLAQVSSRWLGPATRMLYATPRLHSFLACKKFARTLSDNPSLSCLVHGIDLCPVLDNHHHPPCIGDPKIIRSILALEGLQSVTLGGHLAIRAERFLHLLMDPYEVRELHVDGSLLSTSLSFHPSLEWDEVIATKFTCLRKLRLTNVDLDIIYPSIPYHLQLRELILDNVYITAGYLSHLLHDTSSLDRLCVISKSGAEFDDQIVFVLASCAVQFLEYEAQSDPAAHAPLIFNHVAPFLRCLHLQDVHANLETLASVSQSCLNLEELSILGRTISILPCEWAEFIGSGVLSSLRCLGVPWGTYDPPFTKWSGPALDLVHRAAVVRNVQLINMTSSTSCIEPM
jgi:hypothetical protein